MVHLLSARAYSVPQPVPPQRRRVIVIGAGAAGTSAAFHLAEHSLLIERRQNLEEFDDQPHYLPLGTARARPVGPQDRRADRQRPGVSVEERTALAGRDPGSGTHPLIQHHVSRWQPPDLAPDRPAKDESVERIERLSLSALIPHLRGEVLCGATVVRISPSQRLVELADGARFVYDKLLSTVPLVALTEMVLAELPWRIRCDETLRYWLNARDIEVTDSATRLCYGDVDGFAAGRRVAGLIKRAITEKFRAGTASNAFGKRLFQPRVVMR